MSGAKYQRVNSARVTLDEVVNNVENIQEVQSSEITIGDIIKLRRGQISPCDVLVFSISEHGKINQQLKVDSFLQNGSSILESKEAVAVLKNFEFQDITFKSYLKRLNGKLQYYRCHIDPSKIYGTFKLATDPRGESFSNDKVISQGSILHADFVVGIVLFNGKKSFPCQFWSLPNIFTQSKLSEVHSKQRSFASLLVIISLIACLYSELTSLRVAQYLIPKFAKGTQSSSFSAYFSLYFSCITLSINTTLNLACLITSLLLQREFAGISKQQLYKGSVSAVEDKKAGKQMKILTAKSPLLDKIGSTANKMGVEVFEPVVLPDLGDLDDIIFDKSGTLVDNHYQVASIATKNQLYHASQDPGFLIDHSQIEILDVSDISPEIVFGDNNFGSAPPNGDPSAENKKVILVNMEVKKQVMSGMGNGPPRFEKQIKPEEMEAFGKRSPMSQEYKKSKFTSKISTNQIDTPGFSDLRAVPLMTTDGIASSMRFPTGDHITEQPAEAKKLSLALASSPNEKVRIDQRKEANRPAAIFSGLEMQNVQHPASTKDRSPKSPTGATKGEQVTTPGSRKNKGDNGSPFKLELTSAKQDEVLSIEEGFAVTNEQSGDNLVKGAFQFLHEYKTKDVAELLTLFAICNDGKLVEGM
jgi:magnesium-transporting ATPase (P-type)